jgi:hypothetical protein
MSSKIAVGVSLVDLFKARGDRCEVITNLLCRVVPSRFWPSWYLEQLVRTRTDGRIHSGPFAGMRYVANAADVHIHIPKLLGIYERELHASIDHACALNLSRIVNIGAAEGYYAVGMALRNPKARIIAFETESTSRAALADAVRLNHVESRMETRGKCEPEDLERVLASESRPFVICDAEGHESVLLDPATVPSLQRAWILVELHEFIERGISDKIRERFVATHKITEICQQERTIADFPFKNFYIRWLPESYLRWAVSESRPEQMSWFWMRPIHASA